MDHPKHATAIYALHITVGNFSRYSRGLMLDYDCNSDAVFFFPRIVDQWIIYHKIKMYLNMNITFDRFFYFINLLWEWIRKFWYTFYTRNRYFCNSLTCFTNPSRFYYTYIYESSPRILIIIKSWGNITN